jgi:CBS domain containing-hemolysin-like protein
MDLIISTALAGCMLLAVSLHRVYGALPVKELKRRARDKDQTAMLLHQAATYGVSLRVLLWFFVGLSAGGFFVYTSTHLDTWLAFVLACLITWVGFTQLTSKNVRALSLWFATHLAPVFAWILQFLHTPISWVAEFINRHRPVRVHTGLYEKEDLLELLHEQKAQADNRIEEYELELAIHSLTFGEISVADVLTPRRVVKHVSVDDTVGPLLMDELHGSGFSRFPVYEGKKDNFVGTLFMKDLINKQATGKVKDVMRREVCYVHEEQTLYDALQAILKTRRHLLIVVNSFEEYVGALTIEDVLEQIVGTSIVDEFDEHDDLRAVAKQAAQKEHDDHEEVPTTVETDAEVVE